MSNYLLRTKIPDHLKPLPKIKSCTYRKYRPEYERVKSLLTICCEIIDNEPKPDFYAWSEYDIANWNREKLNCSEFEDAFIKNKIRGMHLAVVEADGLPKMNIQNFDSIKSLTAIIREKCRTDQDEFKRRITLPVRRPITLYLWYKTSRGPRDTTTPSEHLKIRNILRQEMIEKAKFYELLNHWNRVPSYRPLCPHVLVGNIRRVNPMTGTTQRQNFHPTEKFHLLKKLCINPSEFNFKSKNSKFSKKFIRSIKKEMTDNMETGSL